MVLKEWDPRGPRHRIRPHRPGSLLGVRAGSDQTGGSPVFSPGWRPPPHPPPALQAPAGRGRRGGHHWADQSQQINMMQPPLVGVSFLCLRARGSSEAIRE